MPKQSRVTFVVVGATVLIALVFYLLGGSELWHFQRLASRYAQYARGGSYKGSRPSMSADKKTIVFSTPRTGRGDIYAARLAEERMYNLTNSEDYEGEPCYSPDGKRIAYIREDEKAISHVWVMDADGRNQRQLTSDTLDDIKPVFDPMGNAIVFTRIGVVPGEGADYQLYSVSLSDGKEALLSPPKSKEDGATFDASGSAMLFISNAPPGGLWLKNTKTGKSKHIGKGRLSPVLSPDGARIAYILNEEPRKLCIMNSDGSLAQAVYTTDDYLESCCFTPDSKSILLVAVGSAQKVGRIVVFDIATRKIAATVPINIK